MSDMDNLDMQLNKLRIEKDKKGARRGRGRWVAWVVAILFCAGAAYAIHSKMNAPVTVRTVPVEQEKSEPGKGPALVTASGYVVPRHKVEVSSKIIGRVKEILVKRGDRVSQGDVLLRIEDEEYRAQLRSAEAQAASLRARVAELKTGSRPQEIAASEAALASSETSLASAQLDYDRAVEMEKEGVISTQELDHARAARDVARARRDAEQKNLELVRIGPRLEQIEAAEAQLREAEANIEFIQTSLDNTVIRAPISGVILEKLAEQGELVTNTNFGGTRGAKSSVVSMADLGDLQTEVDLNELDIAKVKPGQKAEIRLDAAAGRAFAAEVDEISPQADRQKGTVQVKVRFLEVDDSIKTETNARVTFFGDAAADGNTDKPRLWIPKSAVQQTGKDAFIYVLSEDKALLRPVKTGVEGALGIEITEGLTGAERIILSPLENLSDGASVRAPA